MKRARTAQEARTATLIKAMLWGGVFGVFLSGCSLAQHDMMVKGEGCDVLTVEKNNTDNTVNTPGS